MEPTPPRVNPALTPEPGQGIERLAFAQGTEGHGCDPFTTTTWVTIAAWQEAGRELCDPFLISPQGRSSRPLGAFASSP